MESTANGIEFAIQFFYKPGGVVEYAFPKILLRIKEYQGPLFDKMVVENGLVKVMQDLDIMVLASFMKKFFEIKNETTIRFINVKNKKEFKKFLENSQYLTPQEVITHELVYTKETLPKVQFTLE